MRKRKLNSAGVPWIENCEPNTIEELAVQKKKVSEVEDWLQNCFKQQKKASILLLTGPPGAGKTATVLLLCKLLKAELLHWNNTESESLQSNVNFSNPSYDKKWVSTEEQVSQFYSFLLRSNKYSLFAEERKVILVEEFPNAFLRDPGLFHGVLRKYVSSGRHPLIFIISDNTKGESLESRLFPNDLKHALKISNIGFNPITQAKLLKVLTKINETVLFESCYVKLSKPQLEEIALNSIGDVRNAINSLQFFSISSFKKPKPKLQTKSISASTKEKTQEHQRDSSLFLFHALGKVLYCKRDKSAKGVKDSLPEHMKHLEKDPPLANAEEVFDKTSLSAEAFSLFLHENFLPFTSDINSVADCLHWFSESDTLSSFWSAQDSLSDYKASIASRGLMFNIGCSSSNSWRPLHKPQYYDCVKKQNSLMSKLRRSFKDNFVTFKELQTEILPFMDKIKCSGLKSDQTAVVREIGEMKVKRYFRPEYETLKEKEVPNLETEDFEIASDSCDKKDDVNDSLEVPDEEIVIEEYDF